MTIYCDENVSPTLVKGLSILQDRLEEVDGLKLEVKSLVDIYGRGAKDEE